jgi:hypothetical protein
MSTEKSIPSRIARYYRVIVEGKVDASWSDWLNGMELVSQKEADGMQVTTISGVVVDQVALRGLLNRLWDLNMVLNSVQEMGPTMLSN